MLIVLDGLDEVADVNKRRDVVARVTEGVGRLREISASLQVIITTRPTAFAAAAGFPEREYQRFQLGPLSKALITAYSEKWLVASRLPEQEFADVRRILRQKIEQPHLRDLARNAMQLTILLSLIHTRGSSLPDKRTALYNGYVELFFNRESEKAPLVRDHRVLLEDIHGYLAWELHSEAEKGAHGGSISVERLQKLLVRYLEAEERDPSLVAHLFTGMVERIVFLVSRVEGTLEFEVQPLREYFVARHLYVTAPYSPTGAEQKGTKPDRFDTIAPNPYWLNVTRFFSGCFCKGELACLIHRLPVLSDDDRYEFTSHARRLTTMLLADWVFSQDQRCTRDAVALVLGGDSLRNPVAKRRREYLTFSEETSILPAGCGRDELVQSCFEHFRRLPVDDYAAELSRIVQFNAPDEERDHFWRVEVKSCRSRDLMRWLCYGLYLGSLTRADPTTLSDLFARGMSAGSLAILCAAGHSNVIAEAPDRCEALVEEVLAGRVQAGNMERDLLSRFVRALNCDAYRVAFHHVAPCPLNDLLSRRYPYLGDEGPLDTTEASPCMNSTLEKCQRGLLIADRERSRNASDWATDLAPWNALVEEARTLFGDNWQCYRLANMAAGVRAPDARCTEYPDLFDHSQPLCYRARYARLRAGAPRWWRAQLQSASTGSDRMFWALLLLTWGNWPTKLSLQADVTRLLDSLSFAEWEQLADAPTDVPLRIRRRASLGRAVDTVSQPLSSRSVVALAANASEADRRILFERFLANYRADDIPTLRFCESLARPDASATEDRGRYFLLVVAGNPGRYPRALVYEAEELCQADAARLVTPVRDIAVRDCWFPY